MTIAELDRWAIQRDWNVQRLHWLQVHLQRYKVVPSSPDRCRAEVTVAVQAAGGASNVPMRGLQLLRLYDAPLIMRNSADCLGVPGLLVISHPK
jgi:hypothetical protein